MVIGGCGFIGSHIVSALKTAGHNVRVLDLRPEAFRPPVPEVEYVYASFLHTESLRLAMSGVDRVIHCASTTVPVTASQSPIRDIEENLVGTVNLLSVMQELRIGRLVFFSSGGTVYGPQTTIRVSEKDPIRPTSEYGACKAAIEIYIRLHHARHGLSYCILRPSNPYGPRQGNSGTQGVIGTFLNMCAEGGTIKVWGDGSVVRDYIHVADLIGLSIRAIDSETIGTFNAGSGEGHSVSEILSAVTAASKTSPPVVHLSAMPHDVPRIVLDIAKAKLHFGWEPKVRLEDGLRDTWNWLLRSRAATLGANPEVL